MTPHKNPRVIISRMAWYITYIITYVECLQYNKLMLLFHLRFNICCKHGICLTGWATLLVTQNQNLPQEPTSTVENRYSTLPKFNIAPEKWWLEDYFPIGKVTSQGLC